MVAWAMCSQWPAFIGPVMLAHDHYRDRESVIYNSAGNEGDGMLRRSLKLSLECILSVTRPF